MRTGPPRTKYFSTVRGETWIPSFSFNSSAMRPCPHVGFSAAISRISFRRSLGRQGLPVGFDFQRQQIRNPLRCQRMSVSGLTLTSAPRQANHRLRVAISQRVESSARRGLRWRSWNRASRFRKNRFSATNAARGRGARQASRARSYATEDNVHRQGATARKLDDRTGSHAKECYRHATARRGRSFCGPQGSRLDSVS